MRSVRSGCHWLLVSQCSAEDCRTTLICVHLRVSVVIFVLSVEHCWTSQQWHPQDDACYYRRSPSCAVSAGLLSFLKRCETIDSIDCQRIVRESFVDRVEHYRTLASTQERAHTVAADGTGESAVLIVADRQSAGRGRGANRWHTGEGSLAFSLLWDPRSWGLAPLAMPQRSLAAAVALVDTVTPLLPGHVVGLHWPNDVYVADRKLAGILIDVLVDGRHILGVGVNTNNRLDDAPADVRPRAVSIVEMTQHGIDHTDFLIRLLRAIRTAFDPTGALGAEIGSRFNRLCLQIGGELTIDVGGKAATGVCAGIDPDGALLLDTPGGRRRFTCGVLR